MTNWDVDRVHWTPSEVAERLRVSTGTLWRWRSQGKGPDFLRVGGVGGSGHVLYPRDAVRRWESEHMVTLGSSQ